MFKKAFILASLTALTAVVASAGCSSSSSTTTSGEDAGTSTGNDSGTVKPRPDGSTTTDDGASSCYDIGSGQVFKWKDVGPAGQCTDAQVEEVIANCLTSDSSGDAGEDKCTPLQTSIPSCFNCVLPTKDTTYLPVLLPAADNKHVLLDAYACISMVVGKPECASKMVNAITCSQTACAACSDDTATKACEQEALNDKDGCGNIADEACFTAVNGATDEQLTQCGFGKNDDPSKNFEATAKKVGHVLCVTGNANASTDASTDAN